MSGDWIPASVDLTRKLEVLHIARDTGRSRHEVAGLLIEFWGWGSGQSADGVLHGVALGDLPGLIGADVAFWQAVDAAGWLIVGADHIEIPNATEWITRAAKARLANSRRQSRLRNRAASNEENGCRTPIATKARQERDKSATTEQKRTEQKRTTQNRTTQNRTTQNRKGGTPQNPPPEIPEEIDTPAARVALDEWLTFKREKGQAYKPSGLAGLLKKWAAIGAAEFIEAVAHSTANNYVGLYSPGDSRAKRQQPQRTATRTDESGRAKW